MADTIAAEKQRKKPYLPPEFHKCMWDISVKANPANNTTNGGHCTKGKMELDLPRLPYPPGPTHCPPNLACGPTVGPHTYPKATSLEHERAMYVPEH